MTTTERVITKIEMCELILRKCDGYGSAETPLTMSIFKAIIKDALKEQEETLIFINKS